MRLSPFHALPGLLGTVTITLLHSLAWAEPAKATDKTLVDRGRYIVSTAGCNDCHTPGYMQTNGKVDEKLWLTGDAFGWRGPWGTTYAPNLRLYMAGMSEAQ